MEAELQKDRIDILLTEEKHSPSSSIVESEEKEQVERAVSSSSMLDASRLEKARLENNKLEQEVEKLKQEVENISQDRNERKKYATSALELVCNYLLAVLLIELMCGGKIIHLEENVQLALIGSLAINVIGVLLIVMRYLFSK